MKLLELVMIVKNSGEILRDCLRHNKKYFDYWTILDTGSSDNTKDIIKEELKDIQGCLYEDDFFVDFKQARNKALDLASGTCKYYIILDDSYKIIGGDNLRVVLEKSKQTSYSINIGNYKDGLLQNSYISNRIFKCSEKYRYKYRVHEFLELPEKEVVFIEQNTCCISDIETTEHKNRSAHRYKRDIELLQLDLKDYPNDLHVLYYLAKTYYNMDEYELSLNHFKKLYKACSLLKSKNKTLEEYLFASEYETACIGFLLNKSIPTFEFELSKLLTKYPHRCEIAYKLAIVYKDTYQIDKAEVLLDLIITKPKPLLLKTLIEQDIYEFLIPYLYLETKIELMKIKQAVPILKKLLDIYPNNQPLLNIKYSLVSNMDISEISLSDGKTIVFHSGGEECLIQHWNPKGDTRISGSEYMVINLAQEFQKHGFRVFIIGSFENKEKHINYQCIHKGIEYIDYTYFSDFALMYKIDYLIVSRYTSNLVYYRNIQRVYLWVHDVLPITTLSKCFQVHKEKFKSVITVSHWQKQNIIDQLNIPDDRIIVSRNAIITSRFDIKTQKIPFRFIYTSDPGRGLPQLLKLIPQIKKEFPLTTLHIFVSLKLIDSETLSIINQLKDYVFLNERLNQTEIAIELLKSDVWLYPTLWKETYCIAAVEAMISKCLVATTNIAGVGEICQNKALLCDVPVDKHIDDLYKKLCLVLKNQALKNYYIDKAYNWAIKQNFETLYDEWVENILI